MKKYLVGLLKAIILSALIIVIITLLILFTLGDERAILFTQRYAAYIFVGLIAVIYAYKGLSVLFHKHNVNI